MSSDYNSDSYNFEEIIINKTEYVDSECESSLLNEDPAALVVVKRKKQFKDLKSNTNGRKRLKPDDGKRRLAELMEKEEVIWNKKHSFHSNPNALLAGWRRIADGMPSTTVPQCRTMWKSLRDALRYRMKMKEKRKPGDSGAEENDDFEEENELEQMLHFLLPTMKFPRNPVHHYAETSLMESADESIDFKSSSKYSFASKVEKKDEKVENKDEISESVQSISKAITEMVGAASCQIQLPPPTSPFKYDYIWKLIESLYTQMDESAINEVNQKIINVVYEKLKETNRGK